VCVCVCVCVCGRWVGLLCFSLLNSLLFTNKQFGRVFIAAASYLHSSAPGLPSTVMSFLSQSASAVYQKEKRSGLKCGMGAWVCWFAGRGKRVVKVGYPPPKCDTRSHLACRDSCLIIPYQTIPDQTRRTELQVTRRSFPWAARVMAPKLGEVQELE
jgi:hypothetical protein